MVDDDRRAERVVLPAGRDDRDRSVERLRIPVAVEPDEERPDDRRAVSAGRLRHERLRRRAQARIVRAVGAEEIHLEVEPAELSQAGENAAQRVFRERPAPVEDARSRVG